MAKKDAPNAKKGAKLPRPKGRPRGRPFRRGNGDGRKFVKGHGIKSPGRPPLPAGYREAFDMMEPEARQALRDIVNDPTHKDREKAAEYITNRKRGKPTERAEISGPEGGAVQIEGAEQVTELLRRLAGEKTPE